MTKCVAPKKTFNHLDFFFLILFLTNYLRCFDTVFQRQYQYFSIALKVVFSLSDRYKILTSNWLWIEIGENVVLSKIDITMTTINKNFEIDKSRILGDLDLLLKIQHQELKVWCLANNLRKKLKIVYL